jgi:hypothetical protein
MEFIEEKDPVESDAGHAQVLTESAETSFDEDSESFDAAEFEMDSHFYRKKRISCFAHNMMLAVSKVKNITILTVKWKMV